MSLLSTIQYQIAELRLDVKAPDRLDVRKLLTSFAPFLVEDSELSEGHLVVELSCQAAPHEIMFGTLLTRESIAWGDNFCFYESDSAYYATIVVGEKDNVWVMESSKDFKSSMIYLRPTKDEHVSSLLSWFIMMAFGQASLSYDTILVHASVVEVAGAGYAFLGKSGTGKSTHSRQWLRVIPGACLLNDDNPAIRVQNDKVFIFGTPWSGKTNCYINRKVLLQGLIRLEQSKSNNYVGLSGMDAFIHVVPSCTAIRWNHALFTKMNNTVQTLLSQIKVGYLKCLPNEEAALLCFQQVSETKNVDRGTMDALCKTAVLR